MVQLLLNFNLPSSFSNKLEQRVPKKHQRKTRKIERVKQRELETNEGDERGLAFPPPIPKTRLKRPKHPKQKRRKIPPADSKYEERYGVLIVRLIKEGGSKKGNKRKMKV